jgi:hypothetical protein
LRANETQYSRRGEPVARLYYSPETCRWWLLAIADCAISVEGEYQTAEQARAEAVLNPCRTQPLPPCHLQPALTARSAPEPPWRRPGRSRPLEESASGLARW